MKLIKKLLKILGVIFLLLLGLIIAIPLLFGEQIKKAVRDYVNNDVVNKDVAEVYFKDVGISMFSNFPNIAVSLSDFGVAGKDEFAGDTLADVQNLKVVVNLWSAFFGDQYEVGKIALETPRIHAKVLRNGKANWDIMKPSTDTAAVADTSSSPGVKLQLKNYAITQGTVIYDDRAGDMYLSIYGLNHSGSGKFNADVYDFDTETTADSLSFEMAGTQYLNKARVNIDMTVNIDSKNNAYTLKDNSFGLNELVLGLDGSVKLAGDDVITDLKFNTKENTFKNILSMVPGVYTQDFGDMKTDGTFTLDGWVKGTYNAKSLPGFHVNLAVSKGFFQYPDLPAAVSDINFDLKTDCADGNLDHLKIDMPSFHCLFGKNPIDARLVMSGLNSDNMNLDAKAKAALDLGELLTMFPMEGQELKGKFMIDGTAKGILNYTAGKFPTVNAKMKLENGFYKTADFPSALSNMSLDATMMNTHGSLKDTWLKVTQFHSEIDNEPVDATLEVRDFDNPTYSATMKGRLNLEKLNKIYPIEGTTMSGILNADITTAGTYNDVMASAWNKLPTSGSLAVSKLAYASTDMPQGLKIDDGLLTFTPQQIRIDKYVGAVGKSPVNITGSLENYLGWIMSADQTLRGVMSLNSTRFDVNEWMVESPETASPAPAAAPAPASSEMYVFEVPKGIDFTFNCAIAKVLYDNLTMDNLAGRVIMQNQEIRFENCGFRTLGGDFKLAGSYNTRDITKPGFDLNFNLANLDVQQTYKAFATVQAFAPVAKFVNGKFNSNFNMKGTLKQDMTPDLNSLTCTDGLLAMLNGTISNFKVLDLLHDKTKLPAFKTMNIKDTKIFFEIRDGRIHTKNPFPVQVGKTKMMVMGSTGMDGTLKYDLDLDIPAGEGGQAAMNALNSMAGGRLGSAPQNVKMKLGLGGTADNPKITSVNGGSTGEMVQDVVEDVKETVKDTVKAVVNNVVDDGKAKARAEADKILAEAQKLADKTRADAKVAADRVRAEGETKAKQIEASAKNPIEKIAKQKLAKETREAANASAAKIEREADEKANKIMADARAKADALLK